MIGLILHHLTNHALLIWDAYVLYIPSNKQATQVLLRTMIKHQKGHTLVHNGT